MKTFTTGLVLDAITQPRTKTEIAEVTNLSVPQITEAIQTLREAGQPIQKMGASGYTHYYLAKYNRVKERVKPAYSQMYDLMDAGEFWAGEEVMSIMDFDYTKFKNCMKQLRNKGVVIEKRKSSKGLRMYEYRILAKDIESL